MRYHLEREAEERGVLSTAGVQQRKEECRDPVEALRAE
jgi:hypothetical protein